MVDLSVELLDVTLQLSQLGRNEVLQKLTNRLDHIRHTKIVTSIGCEINKY
jgi:hypothetical protein